MLITRLLLVLDVYNVKPTQRNHGLLIFWGGQIWPWPNLKVLTTCLLLKILFIFGMMPVVLFRWIHLASDHRCILGLLGIWHVLRNLVRDFNYLYQFCMHSKYFTINYGTYNIKILPIKHTNNLGWQSLKQISVLWAMVEYIQHLNRCTFFIYHNCCLNIMRYHYTAHEV